MSNVRWRTARVVPWEYVRISDFAIKVYRDFTAPSAMKTFHRHGDLIISGSSLAQGREFPLACDVLINNVAAGGLSSPAPPYVRRISSAFTKVGPLLLHSDYFLALTPDHCHMYACWKDQWHVGGYQCLDVPPISRGGVAQLSLHDTKLIPINYERTYPRDQNKASQANLPSWRLIGLALLGLSLLCCGLSFMMLRYRDVLGTCMLVLGCILWAYTFNLIVEWRLGI